MGGVASVLRAIVVTQRRFGVAEFPDELNKELASCLRYLLTMLRECDQSNSLTVVHCRSLCERLTAAFEASPPVQALTIDTMTADLMAPSGVEPERISFERQVRSFA